MVQQEIAEIMEEFDCDEIKAVNFLLQLISQDEFEKFTEEEQTLKKAA